jgi:hypothetical protein
VAALRHGSAAARFLGLLVRIPPGPWMSVSRESYVFSGGGLCVGLITRPEEAFTHWGCYAMAKKNIGPEPILKTN